MLEYGWGDYEETYMVVRFHEYWTVEDYVQCVISVSSKLMQLDHEINFIVDLRHSAAPPATVFSVITRSISQRPKNVGRVVVVTTTPLWKRVYGTLINYQVDHDNKLNIRFVMSMDEAYSLILSARAIS
ncbi:MAG: hypothetical protein AAF846_09820 [Chloroflexota bacterium]